MHKCVYCQKEFKKKRPNQKFCSKECLKLQTKADRQSTNRSKSKQIFCKNCGFLFKSTRMRKSCFHTLCATCRELNVKNKYRICQCGEPFIQRTAHHRLCYSCSPSMRVKGKVYEPKEVVLTSKNITTCTYIEDSKRTHINHHIHKFLAKGGTVKRYIEDYIPVDMIQVTLDPLPIITYHNDY